MKNKNSCSADVHERADKGFGPLNENLGRSFMYGFIILGLIFGLSGVVSAEFYCPDGWQYQQEINISNVAGDLTDYQLKMVTNLTDEYNDGKIQSNCEDLRFVNSTGDELSYWVEECNTSGEISSIWVKVSFLRNNTNTPIYVCYGNSSAGSKSNGTATFEFFDDFDNLDKWDKFGNSGWITTTVVDGRTVVKVVDPKEDPAWISTKDKLDNANKIIIERMIRRIGVSEGYGGAYDMDDYYGIVKDRNIAIWPWDLGGGYSVAHRTGDNYEGQQQQVCSYWAGINTCSEVGTKYMSASWNASKFTIGESILIGEYLGEIVTVSTPNILSSGYVQLLTDTDYPDGQGFYVDWIIIHKHAASEPTISSFGAEEEICVDNDEDGVSDDIDYCPDTIIPEDAPTMRLGVNRFALVDDDGIFDTKLPKGKGKGPQKSYTIEDTQGCSCSQIIDILGLGKGHEKFGCSISVMDDFIAMLEG
ncbi:hypothetical protein BEH94_03890 [Candidatus Altiarchaeales archaeon WOR_SM1_SCG]|nr:hypothetical protein BEH94_03890 [Candidatus Altiarchaeales archaeon WOR_SM1_SCG]